MGQARTSDDVTPSHSGKQTTPKGVVSLTQWTLGVDHPDPI